MIHFVVALTTLATVPLGAYIVSGTSLEPSQLGYLVSANAIFSSLVSYFVSNRPWFSRLNMPLFVASLAIALFLMTLSRSPYIMIIFQSLIGGLSGAITVMNFNRTMHTSSQQNRKSRIAMLLSAYPLALAVGVPVLILAASTHGWKVAFYVLSVMTLFVALCGIKIVNTKSELCIDIASNEHQASVNGGIYKRSDFWLGSGAIFMCVFSTFLFSIPLPSYLLTQQHVSASMLSIAYVLGGLGCFFMTNKNAQGDHCSLSIKGLTLSSVGIGLLAWIAFYVQQSNVAVMAFVLFVVVSASRTIMVKTEALYQVDSGVRSLMIGSQPGIQHTAMAAAGLIGSAILSYGNEGGYASLVEVGVCFLLLVPVLYAAFKHHLSEKKPSVC